LTDKTVFSRGKTPATFADLYIGRVVNRQAGILVCIADDLNTELPVFVAGVRA
jgi:hypothetical protein